MNKLHCCLAIALSCALTQSFASTTPCFSGMNGGGMTEAKISCTSPSSYTFNYTSNCLQGSIGSSCTPACDSSGNLTGISTMEESYSSCLNPSASGCTTKSGFDFTQFPSSPSKWEKTDTYDPSTTTYSNCTVSYS